MRVNLDLDRENGHERDKKGSAKNPLYHDLEIFNRVLSLILRKWAIKKLKIGSERN